MWYIYPNIKATDVTILVKYFHEEGHRALPVNVRDYEMDLPIEKVENSTRSRWSVISKKLLLT